MTYGRHSAAHDTHLLQHAVVTQAQLLLLHPLQTVENALRYHASQKIMTRGRCSKRDKNTCSCCSHQRSATAILLSCPWDCRPLALPAQLPLPRSSAPQLQQAVPHTCSPPRLLPPILSLFHHALTAEQRERLFQSKGRGYVCGREVPACFTFGRCCLRLLLVCDASPSSITFICRKKQSARQQQIRSGKKKRHRHAPSSTHGPFPCLPS